MRSVPIRGKKHPLAIGKMLCLGKNFAAHAREMGDSGKNQPVVFLKPASAILLPGNPILLPPFSGNVHYEVELVVAVGKTGKNIPEERVTNHILGYAVGLDLTARDLQSLAKQKGEPWAVAKGFDGSAPLSEITPRNEAPQKIEELEISLRINGVIRQKALLSEMIWSIPRTLAYLSTIFTLERGDLVFMGTPEGVGPLHPGDRMEAEIRGLVSVAFEVTGNQFP